MTRVSFCTYIQLRFEITTCKVYTIAKHGFKLLAGLSTIVFEKNIRHISRSYIIYTAGNQTHVLYKSKAFQNK